MAKITRPFWKILVVAAEHGARVPLNCDECFIILEYLAEAAVHGAEEYYLRDAVRQHIESCPKCREHHLQRLNELEAKFDTRIE